MGRKPTSDSGKYHVFWFRTKTRGGHPWTEPLSLTTDSMMLYKCVDGIWYYGTSGGAAVSSRRDYESLISMMRNYEYVHAELDRYEATEACRKHQTECYTADALDRGTF